MPQLFIRLLTQAIPLSGGSAESMAVGVAALDEHDAVEDQNTAGAIGPVINPSDEGSSSATDYEVRADWLILESNGDVRAQGTSNYRDLGELIDPSAQWLADPDNIVVIVPTQLVLTLQCDVPGRNAGQIRRALPFAAEEYIASDIELTHIANAPIKVGQPVRCNIVEQTTLNHWLNCLASLGIRPGAMYTEADLLPWEADQVALFYDRDTVLIASSEQAVAMDESTLAYALEGLSAQRLVCINGEPDEITLSQLDPKPEVSAVSLQGRGVLEYLASQYQERSAQAACINMLQGAYQPAKAVNPNTQKWRTVIALAAGWALIAFVGMIVQGWWAQKEADRLTAESFAFYKSIFRNESQPVSIEQLRRRVNAKLGRDERDGTAASDFVGLMAHFANVLDGNSLVTSANYQREELSIEVMLASYDDLDPIKNKLAEVGVEVNVTSAEQDGNQVRSRMRLKFTG